MVQEKTRQCLPPQAAVDARYDRRSAAWAVVHPRSSSVFRELRNSAVTADLLGRPSKVKALVAEEKGARAVRRLIRNSIRFLMDHFSTAIVCRAVLPGACHSDKDIVDRDRGTPHSQFRPPDWTAKTPNGFLQAHIHPQSVTLILCAARAHHSFSSLADQITPHLPSCTP